MKYPEIVIKDAWLLRENASNYIHELKAEPGEQLVGGERMKQIVQGYKDSWQPYESKILKGMCETFDLEFKHNIIDVYIAPWFHAFSDPLVVGAAYDPDLFIDVLAHELLHRLFTANTAYDIDKSARRLEWQKLFGDDHSFVTLVHIPVHAGLKALYLDVLNEPQRLHRDIERSKNIGKGYDLAWDYVEKNDYQDIILRLKKSYIV